MRNHIIINLLTLLIVNGNSYSSTCPSEIMNNEVDESGSFVAAKKTEENMNGKTIVDIAVANPKFSTLVDALKTAELVSTLAGEKEFTVFAPTNAAFEKIPKEKLDELLANKEKLKKILTYHVVPGKVLASEVVELSDAETVEGGKITFKVEDDKVYVNEAEVVETDVDAKNGVIHVIDTVLTPEE